MRHNRTLCNFYIPVECIGYMQNSAIHACKNGVDMSSYAIFFPTLNEGYASQGDQKASFPHFVKANHFRLLRVLCLITGMPSLSTTFFYQTRNSSLESDALSLSKLQHGLIWPSLRPSLRPFLLPPSFRLSLRPLFHSFSFASYCTTRGLLYCIFADGYYSLCSTPSRV